MRRIVVNSVVLGISLAAFGCEIAHCDTFVLKSGGRVEGRWLNQTAPRSSPYEVETAGGLTVRLQRADVQQVISLRDAEEQYERLAPKAPDTVQGQWKLATWCRDHHLPDHRQIHLRRILDLDPDHLPARRALGYAQVGGQWMTQEEWRRQQGYEEYRGRWRMTQDIELLEQRRKTDQAQKEWAARLRTLREMLAGEDAAKARQQLLAIQDANAVVPLTELLAAEQYRLVKLIYVEALGNIDHNASLNVLMLTSLSDHDEEIRVACLDELKQRNPVGLQDIYIKSLGEKNNLLINRAAYALAEVGDQSAVMPLIDSLVTTHTITLKSGGNKGPGQTMTTTFMHDPSNQASPSRLLPNMGSGLNVGETKKTITRRVNNSEVLTALLKITQAPNYGYDQQAWRRWFESQHSQ